jgi:predicted small metal-binding protein
MYIHNSTNNKSLLSLPCLDTGAGVIECDYVARGRTEEEPWVDAAAHINKGHAMKIEDITPQIKKLH